MALLGIDSEENATLTHHPIPRSDLSAQVFGEEDFEDYLGAKWQRVTSDVDWVRNKNKLWVSLGCTQNREKLFFNELSPLIHELKRRVHALASGRTLKDTLGIVVDVINSLTQVPGEAYEVTDARLEPALDQLLRPKRTASQPFVCIEMTELIQHRILVCRHKGLLAAALLGYLVEQHCLEPGSVRQYRSTIEMSGQTTAHTWSVYRSYASGHVWICDPRWRIFENVNADFEGLSRKYTKEVMSFMMQRLDGEDVYFPLVQDIEDSVLGVPFKLEAFQNSEPGLILCFNFQQTDSSLSAFRQALLQQSIHSSEFNSSVYVSIIENPAILNLKFDKLMRDYELLKSLIPAPAVQPTLVNAALMPGKTVIFSASATSVYSLPPGSALTFHPVDWDELKALECLPEDREFVTGGGLFSRFRIK